MNSSTPQDNSGRVGMTKEQFSAAHRLIRMALASLQPEDRIGILGSTLALTIHQEIFASGTEEIIRRVMGAITNQVAALQQRFPDPNDPTVSTLVPPKDLDRESLN